MFLAPCTTGLGMVSVLANVPCVGGRTSLNVSLERYGRRRRGSQRTRWWSAVSISAIWGCLFFFAGRRASCAGAEAGGGAVA